MIDVPKDKFRKGKARSSSDFRYFNAEIDRIVPFKYGKYRRSNKYIADELHYADVDDEREDFSYEDFSKEDFQDFRRDKYNDEDY